MKPKKYPSLAGKSVLLICFILFFSLTSMVIGKIRSHHSDAEKDFKISKSVPIATLRTIFEKAQKKEVPVYVYVVKRTAEKNAKDFNILLYYSDAAGKMIPIGNSSNEERLKRDATFYISYLHSKRVLKQDVTLGYELNLTETIIRNSASLKITIYPLEPHGNSLTFSPLAKAPPVLVRNDSCKIPPGCLMHVPIITHINASIEKIYSANVAVH